jgi:hypothetical protein
MADFIKSGATAHKSSVKSIEYDGTVKPVENGNEMMRKHLVSLMERAHQLDGYTGSTKDHLGPYLKAIGK